MRRLSSLSLVLLIAILAASASHAVYFSLAAPAGPLTATESKFLGKWRGKALNLEWEIERKPDRSFELAFLEQDSEDPSHVYRNYAVGNWWVVNDVYYFEWTDWWGDEGDFSGVVSEPIESLSGDKIVTLSEGVEAPENIEIRVDQFQFDCWSLKPSRLNAI